MKVLFVFSGNSRVFAISPIIQAQAESLRKLEHIIDYFPVKGKGFGGYLSNVPKLYKCIKQGDYDLIHSHYSYCGVASALATKKPVVCSLMGSDVQESGLWKIIIRFFVKHKWRKTIVKSEGMKTCLLYTSDAADDLLCVDLGGRAIIKKKNNIKNL